MYPGTFAVTDPDRPAQIMAATGAIQTYKQLDDGSMQLANLWRSLGIGPEENIALFLENHPLFLMVCWSAQRSSMRYTAINYHLTVDEVEYIVRDCDARALITSDARGNVARDLAERLFDLDLFILPAEGSAAPDPDFLELGYRDLQAEMATFAATPPSDEGEGTSMLYSSGSTGSPKGVKRPLTRDPMGTTPYLWDMFVERYDWHEKLRYLSPAPLYHAAPLHYNMSAQRAGGTTIIMDHFDAETALGYIERYRATHSQWVPTMFVRMLKLPEETRARFDVSSLKVAIHAAAPCPVPVKQQMIDWWGPILFEYYAGTEGNGSTFIDSRGWLDHPGSVGKPMGVEVHILDDEGNELPAGEPGGIYFAGGRDFEYHKSPEKTRDSYNDKGWSTLGDVGYLDEEGYLYLTDRKAYMIIRGGVNIYPQEAENVLITHPSVFDCAVIGVPHPEFGEEVKGVVQTAPGLKGGPELERELLDYCLSKLARYKCPATIDFEDELPRHPTGKLYKRLIKDRYWGNHDTRIV